MELLEVNRSGIYKWLRCSSRADADYDSDIPIREEIQNIVISIVIGVKKELKAVKGKSKKESQN